MTMLRRRLWFLFGAACHGPRQCVCVPFHRTNEREANIFWPDYVRWYECALSDFYSIIHVVRSHSHDSMGFNGQMRVRSMCVCAGYVDDCTYMSHLCIVCLPGFARLCVCVCARACVSNAIHSTNKLHFPTQFNFAFCCDVRRTSCWNGEA